MEGAKKRPEVRKCEDPADSSTHEATDSKRPLGVKAAKATGKNKEVQQHTMNEFQNMWTIREKDMAVKERMAKMSLFEGLIGRTEGLDEEEKLLKKKLITDVRQYTFGNHVASCHGSGEWSGVTSGESSAIRVLAYGSALDAVDECLRLGATTARLCVENFVESIINVFGNEYLRRPTPYDLQRLLDDAENRGFPGMIGSIDCMHWEWKNCPTAWKGQFARGTLNDINVLDRSPVFDDIINGEAPQVNFSVNGNEYHMGYYLTDGIYPNWATFIQSIRLPQVPKVVLFAQRQEAVRKDVERAFGVLQARFAIVRNPALSWDKVKIGKIMRACIILHNMIVENERDEGTQFNLSDFEEGEASRSSHVDRRTRRMPTNIANQMGVRTEIRDTNVHAQLKRDLVEHIWAKFGTD
ncbi:PREDICTED: uncharacterized protein LOC106308955 [Brassica oleracea var. oleracea]|uniref:uncharacterized protein LOC106308955 n=1 Tax=Brassica oleracea var. oleracea TaxID=109376 RepID=UPI0006A74043|nr:PREDICTED: uncharacterized protein LOC106308955 [Brassica oleracea var. oleracea]